MVRHRVWLAIGVGAALCIACTQQARSQGTTKAPVKFTQAEVKQAVKKFFEESGFGYKDVTVTSVSKPMTLPKSYVLAQVIPMKAYSVSFKAQTTFGKRTMDHWFVMLTRRNGKPMVQGYFSDEDSIKKALGAAGSEWYTKNHVQAPHVQQ